MTTRTVPLPLWEPQKANIYETDRFRQFVNQRHSLSLRDYDDLHRYSVEDSSSSDFWIDLFLFLGLRANKTPSRGYNKVENDAMFPPPKFFPDIKLNFTENLLADKEPDKIAIFSCSEGGTNLTSTTWGQLNSKVEQVADSMMASGVTVGDRVAAVISNRLETIVICLAALSIGAIWSSSSPDMGESGILDRLLQIRPKIVFGESIVSYNGKVRPLMAKHTACASRLTSTPEFAGYVIIEQGADKVGKQQNAKLMSYDDFLSRGSGKRLTFAQLPFSHPGFIVYSSGTTGQPKCIVHSAAGLLLQVKKDSVLGFDVRPTDTVLQYTTTGWIMWAMVLCGLSFASKVIVYDGSPVIPDKLTLFRLIEKMKVTMLGTSARFLTDLKAENVKPRSSLDLSSLRTVTSTGSTLPADVCKWFYEEGFPSNVHLASTCGGTDLACSLVSGNPTLPVYPGEIQCESLGMAVDIADIAKTDFHSIKSSVDPGELVCKKPFPSQPVTFWGADGPKRYYSSYFERFQGQVWNQGDFIQRTADTKGFLMLGRSDGVLNPSGVRFGSAEIYEVVEKLPHIEDTICVGQKRPYDTDEAVVLFVKTKGNQALTGDMKQELKQAIRSARSPRHVPKYIFQVPEIPYTINGKKIEIAVKQIISGVTVMPSGSVANPECLRWYEKYFEIEKMQEKEGASKATL